MLIHGIFFHFIPQNTTAIPYQTRSVEFPKPPKKTNSEYPQNINKQKLPVSHTELIVSIFGTKQFTNGGDDTIGGSFSEANHNAKYLYNIKSGGDEGPFTPILFPS